MNSYNINEIITIIDVVDIEFNQNIFYINKTLKKYIHSIKVSIMRNFT